MYILLWKRYRANLLRSGVSWQVQAPDLRQKGRVLFGDKAALAPMLPMNDIIYPAFGLIFKF